MKTKYLFLTNIAFLSSLFLLTGCIASEPLEIQCDVESVTLSTLNDAAILRADYETPKGTYYKSDVFYADDAKENTKFSFYIKNGDPVTSYKAEFVLHKGTKLYLVPLGGSEADKVAFNNGESVDFSIEKERTFITESEGQYKNQGDGLMYTSTRTYVVSVENDESSESKEDSVYCNFNFNGNYALNDKGNYYIWTEGEYTMFKKSDPTWKNGNPGYTLSKGSALPDEYPTVPVVGGGMDGTDCIKLETKSTGSFGDMVGLPLAAGSQFNGLFDVANATKAPRKATQFGVPCPYIPKYLEADLRYIPGTTFQDIKKNSVSGVVDEPDIYCVFYDNHGGTVMLDGDNVLTSADIVASARLKHHYTYSEEGNRKVPVPELSGDPIHGITGEWQHVKLDLNYDPFQTGSTNEIDLEKLKNYGYSVIFGSTSSWRGAVFEGALESKLYLDNIKVTFYNPFGEQPEPEPVVPQYSVSYNVSGAETGDTYSIMAGASAIVSGAMVDENTTITVSAVPASKRIVSVTINGSDVALKDGAYKFILTGNAQIGISFAKKPAEKTVYTFSSLDGWANTNQMYKALHSGATDENCPAVVSEGVLTLETKANIPTYAAIMKMHNIPGILFNGTMDTYSQASAMSGGASYLQGLMHMGKSFTHKPTKIVISARYKAGSLYYSGNTYNKDVTDEPDIWCVFYRNMGGQVQLSGSDLFTSSNIAGYVRLHDKGKTVGSDWTDIEMDIATYNVDEEALANGNYSLVIGASSSWNGFNLCGAEGSTLEIKSITLYYE